MKFLITNLQKGFSADHLPMSLNKYENKGLKVYYERDQELLEPYLFLQDGYLRDLDMEPGDLGAQYENIFSSFCNSWPLPENITGTFSAALVNTDTQQIVIGTDQVGLYPLYYLQMDGNLFISNSILLIGAISGSEIDQSGIAQRCLGPEFENLGSRTIIKDCKRLLPGERIRFNFKGDLVSKDYDNRLYDNLSDSDQDHELWKDYWKEYKEEVQYCTGDANKVNVALSGGIDSRLALGAIPEEKEISCLTFGSPENYESRIARRLAKIKKASFIACNNPEVYFPSPDMLRKYTVETEAVELCSWLEITETVKHAKKEPLLLGELCEALPARRIEKFASRSFRKNNFFKYYIRGEDYKFTPASDQNFQQWKAQKRKTFKMYYIDRHLDKLDLSIPKEFLIVDLEDNLDELFDRVAAHNLPYAELYDELFSWFTYTRMRLAKQLLLAGSSFNAFSPAMSLRMLRMTSNLHPNIRLNYRFAKKLFGHHKELRKLNRVPTNQAPLIPQNFPDLLKFSMWGLRSMVDSRLTDRMMKNRDISMRYRLFKSINWAEVYQHPAMKTHLKGYFKNNHLGKEYFGMIYEQAVQRKSLTQWPFANINIMNAASLNMELDIINQVRKGR